MVHSAKQPKRQSSVDGRTALMIAVKQLLSEHGGSSNAYTSMMRSAARRAASRAKRSSRSRGVGSKDARSRGKASEGRMVKRARSYDKG